MPKKNKNTLTMMCGLPRCGKSSWIRKNKGDAVVVSPDEIRSDIFGHQFHMCAEDFVWGVAKSFVRMLLKQGKDVIVDATHISFSKRAVWLLIAKEFDAKLKIVWIKTSVEVCKRRSAKSKEGNVVPDAVIDRMAEYFQDPFYEYEKEVDVETIELPKSKESDDFYKKGASTISMNYYIPPSAEYIDKI